MPKTVEDPKIGWKKLQKILDAYKDAINGNAPVQGDGISLSQTASGTIIARRRDGDENQQDQTQQSSFPNKIKISEVAWKQITLVNPVTCVETTETVLVQSPGQSVIVLVAPVT